MFTRPQGIAFKNPSQEACGTGLASRLAGPAGRSITKAVIQIGSKLPRSPKNGGTGCVAGPQRLAHRRSPAVAGPALAGLDQFSPAVRGRPIAWVPRPFQSLSI